MKTLFVFGTRPEAIKLCPLILHQKTLPACFDVRVAVNTANVRAAAAHGELPGHTLLGGGFDRALRFEMNPFSLIRLQKLH